jgi:Outer membrane protein/protective antigen OMA87
LPSNAQADQCIYIRDVGVPTAGRRIFDVAISASDFIKSQEGSTTESKIFSSVVFDSRDNPLLSRRGQRVSFSPYIAGGFLGGNTQIYGLDLEGSQYFHLPWDTILLINGEIATVSQWGNGSDVPIFERLYLGGSNNLRGFPFREVGPQDENGEPLGGKSMWRTTIEWTFPIIEKARGAVFYDTGFVNSGEWSSASTISPRILVSGFGLTCRSARCASIMDIRYSAMDITVAVVSTSTWAINFERIYVVAV